MKKQNKTNHKPQRHLRTEGSLSPPPAPVKTRFCRKDMCAGPWVGSVREPALRVPSGCSDQPWGWGCTQAAGSQSGLLGPLVPRAACMTPSTSWSDPIPQVKQIKEAYIHIT